MAASAYEDLLFVPSSLPALPELLTSFGYSPREIDTHQDKVAYVLHLICTLPYFLTSETGYANLHFGTLVAMIGARHVKKILTELKSAGIVESDATYRPGNKSLGYRITERYHSRIIGQMVLSSTFAAKLQRRRQDEQRQLHANTLLTRMHQDLLQLRVKFEAAQQCNDRIFEATNHFLMTHRQELMTTKLVAADYQQLLVQAAAVSPDIRLKNIKSLRKSLRLQKSATPTLFAILLRSSLDRFDGNLNTLQKIHNRRIPMPTRPVAGSRVYSILTGLSSWLRPFLYRARHENQPLVNLDIKNSQPFLLSVLLRQRYTVEAPSDVEEYIRQTSAGMFYAEVAGAMEAPYSTLVEQKEFKITFFASLFFCENLHTQNSRAGRYFRHAYPNVAQLIHDMKAQRYQDLAIIMQQVEASIIVDEVAGALHRKRIWCATIHDSIVCLAEHQEQVQQIMLDAFAKNYQLRPSVDKEHWCCPVA